MEQKDKIININMMRLERANLYFNKVVKELNDVCDEIKEGKEQRGLDATNSAIG